MADLNQEQRDDLVIRARQVLQDLDVLTAHVQQLTSVAIGMGGQGAIPQAYFDWPVGTPVERAQHDRLPGAWVDATGYAQAYKNNGRTEYHTGIDFNLNTPKFDSDAHAPVFAAADGVVVHSGALAVWGNVIVIMHDWHSPIIWTRYAHGESVKVKAGQSVKRGDQICNVGNAGGKMPYHVHYDVAIIDLGKRPGDWPGPNMQRVKDGYLNPVEFMRIQ